MRIALAQMNPSVGAFEDNLELALDWARSAAENGSELVLFPQYALCGAPVEGLAQSTAFVAVARECVDEFARRSPVTAIIGSFDLYDDDTQAKVTCEDESPEEGGAGFPCIFLCRDGVATPLFDAVDSVACFEVGRSRIALSCDPAFDPSEVTGLPDLLVVLSADVYKGQDTLPTSIPSLREACAHASEFDAVYARCNLVGGQDSVVFSGASFVLSSNGELICAAAPFTSELVVGDTETAEPQGTKAISLPARDSLADDWNALVLATRDYCHKNSFDECVIGVSGGIDSAVIATLACDALGSDKVHGVLLPGPYSSEGSITDAKALAKTLGFDTQTLPIVSSFDACCEALASACGGSVQGLARENMQARMRMVFLMTLSNSYGWILLNTGNKSEAAMGFSTLYGDTAGAFAPLGDVYKTRVFELAVWRNTQSPAIPRAIIDKPPSAELYAGQRDDDRLLPYDILDRILFRHIECAWSRRDLIDSGFDAAAVDEVLRVIARFEFKRRSEPIAPEISKLSLTRRAWPITNRFIDKG
ncbi:MAG: NAD(+) synthase [Actinobacteria bacterium]|nr:NAD(+) synthase [Actinomycetota bacterium]